MCLIKNETGKFFGAGLSLSNHRPAHIDSVLQAIRRVVHVFRRPVFQSGDSVQTRPDRDNWKLARHILAGSASQNQIRPERTAGNHARLPSSLRDENIFAQPIQPLRSWLISVAASRLAKIIPQFSV
jgi:hypothetical protein